MKTIKEYREFLNESGDYDKYALKMYGKKWDDLDRDKQTEVVDAVEGNFPLSRIKRVKEAKVNEASANSYKSWRSKQSPDELEQVKSAIAGMSNKDYWAFGDWLLQEFIGLNPPHNDGDIMDDPEKLDDWLTGQVSNKPAWKLIVQQLRKQKAL